jgi:EAL domain-containing protein (putative c-di-GMP-specific phosphodiesterase class I)/GGDEF domain-containing protein
MSLRFQLSLVLSFLFCIVLMVVFAVSLSSTRHYLEHQLATHAQDAATAMSLTLVPSLAKGDKVLAEAQVMSVFDRGFFERVDVLAADRSVIVSKVLPEQIEGVPNIFPKLFPIATAPGEAHISTGWRQLGKVLVVSQPTFAYQYLWQSAIEMWLWVTGIFLVALMLMQVMLQFVLKPLTLIEGLAQAIQEKRFEQIDIVSRAPELTRVIVAMNQMSRRVSEMLDEITENAERLVRKSFEDEHTDLFNRRGFDIHLKGLLEGDYKFSKAVMMIVDLDGMRVFHQSHSFVEVLEVLTTVTNAAKEVLKSKQFALMGRTNEFSFSFVMANLYPEEVASLASELKKRLSTDLERLPTANLISFDIGVAYFRQDDSRSTIFSRCDLAVESARQTSRNGVFILPDKQDEVLTLGSFGWRRLIQNAVKDQRWSMVSQPVVNLSARDKLLHQEVFGRLIDTKGNLVAAAQFLPMAARHSLMPDVDRSLITLALAHLAANAAKAEHVAINISAQSVTDSGFMNWLAEQLSSLKLDAGQISFEISEFGCSNNFEAATELKRLANSYGAKFGIDNFGLDSKALKLLREIPCDYVKLNSGIIETIATDTEAREIVKSVVHFAHSLDVQVIAMSVETEAQVAILLELAVDGAQGNLFGKPV